MATRPTTPGAGGEPARRARLRARLAALDGRPEQVEGVLVTLGLTVEARDPYTAWHCERVALYAEMLGEALGVDPRGRRALRLAGYLHDLGKVAVPDAVLLKPGPLDPAERRRIEVHPGVGAELLAGLPAAEAVHPLIRHHHERWDGSGYPDGLRGEAIPLGARILAAADVYDALTSARPYRAALPPADAVDILLRETNAGAWDPHVIAVFLAQLRDQGRCWPFPR